MIARLIDWLRGNGGTVDRSATDATIETSQRARQAMSQEATAFRVEAGKEIERMQRERIRQSLFAQAMLNGRRSS
ncbi:MAG: hypothetical protein ACTHQE_07255 [Thermomicrobiales bacterium]